MVNTDLTLDFHENEFVVVIGLFLNRIFQLIFLKDLKFEYSAFRKKVFPFCKCCHFRKRKVSVSSVYWWNERRKKTRNRSWHFFLYNTHPYPHPFALSSSFLISVYCSKHHFIVFYHNEKVSSMSFLLLKTE